MPGCHEHQDRFVPGQPVSEPTPPGVVPGRLVGEPARRAWRRASRQKPGETPTGKQVYENGDIFCIRTPFLMILGSLESQQQALHYCA